VCVRHVYVYICVTVVAVAVAVAVAMAVAVAVSSSSVPAHMQRGLVQVLRAVHQAAKKAIADL